MKILLNLNIEANARNRVFTESDQLLKELLEHVWHSIKELESDVTVVAGEVVKPHLADLQVEKVGIAAPEHASVSLSHLATWASDSCEGKDDPLLVVSPFRGIVCSKQIRVFLEKSRGETWAASAQRLSGNANPFWMNMISPLSYREMTHYVDRNTTFLPKFTKDATIVDQEKWEQYFDSLKVYGSQWLPELYKVDGALMLVQGKTVKECVPLLLDDPAVESLPLIYQLPIFDMARNHPATLQP